MITRDNPSVYGKLFEKANDVLANSLIVLNSGKTVAEEAAERGFDLEENFITSIDGYFTYIDILGEYEYILINAMPQDESELTDVIKAELEDFDPVFMCLPLDEPTFYINTNTRKIEISKDFTGQQVQGDEVAEIIWFSVDRYFDTTDLYNTNIYIQWEVEKNGVKEQGLTPAFGRSLTIQPGKIVFGWPLGSEITEGGSTVKFAVRFYIFDDKGEKLIYNLTTLSSSLKINSSINIDIADDQLVSAIEFNKNAMIYNRLRASATPSLISPAEPIIELNVYAFVNDAVVATKADLEENGKLTLKAKAAVPTGLLGAGKIDYNWFYYDKNGTRKEIAKENASIVYEVSTDTSVSTNDKYYKFNGSDYELVIPEAGANQNPAELGWLEAKTQYVASVAGKYGIVAYNKFNGSVESVTSKDENLFEIPFAVAPTFAANNVSVVLDGDGNATLEMVVTSPDSGVISNYKWYYAETADGEYAAIENALAASHVVSGGVDGYGTAANGYYKLEAANTKNNDTNTVKSDIAIRVSEQIKSPIVLSYDVYEDGSTMKEVINETGETIIVEVNNYATIKINLDPAINADSYDFIWNVSNDGGKTWKEAGVNNSQCELAPGVHKCVITSHYNGQSRTIETSAFTIM